MPQNTFDPHAAPYTSIVRITEDLDGSPWEGSGVLISPDEVLTAGHVTYRTGVGDATNFLIQPDTEGQPPPYQYYFGNLAHHDASVINYPFITTEATALDYAVIHLPIPIVGASTMKVVAGSPVVTAHITGFPAWAGSTMIDDVQTLTQLPGEATYQGSTDGGVIAGGMSGGPVWNYCADGTAQVFGVDSSANAAGYAFMSSFTQAEVEQINAWVAADDYVPPPVAAVPAPAPVLVSQPMPVPVAVDPPPAPTPVPAPPAPAPAPVADTPSPAPTPADPAPITPVNTAPDPDLAFIEAQYASDTSGHTASVVRLYHSALGRLPDLGGMQFWVHDLDTGYPLATLADGFQNAAEFIARFGGSSIPNAEFVSHIYEGVLGREPEQGGYQFWTDNLNSGASTRSQALALISEGAENRAITAQMFVT